MCQEQINQRAVEYAQRPLKKNETPLHSEFLLSQANFIYCITRTGFKVFFDCFCMLLSPHLHNIFLCFRGTEHTLKLLAHVLLSRYL